LLFARQRAALLVFALTVIGTLGWALWEVGFDWWQLAPRGGVVVLLGAWLLMPWITRRLGRPADGLPKGAFSPSGLPLTVAVLVSIGVAGYAMATESWGKQGSLPERQATAGGPEEDGHQGLPPEDWPYYGRTPGGSRYSPLDEITPGNVANLEKSCEYHTCDLRGPEDPA